MSELVTLQRQFTALSRAVQAVAVPAGSTELLEAGTEVMVVQELGGDYTVRNRAGAIFRVAGSDGDAIGREVQQAPQVASQGELTDEAVEAALRTCFDPEIPVNIVDLGLVYEMVTQPLQDGRADVHIQMTLTAPGCGMGQVLANDVKRKLEALAGVRQAKVDIVFDPPWNPSMMSEAARLQTGLY